MKKSTRSRFIFVFFTSLLLSVSVVETAFAQSLASLKGTWILTLSGNTGAGSSAYHVIIDLDKTGSSTVLTPNAQMTSNTIADGIGSSSEFFTIDPATWNVKKRTASASLTCQNHTACGWNLKIQVSKDGQVFNVVDVENTNQTLVGTAVKQ